MTLTMTPDVGADLGRTVRMSPTASGRDRGSAWLVVSPGDINFVNIGPDRVLVDIAVHNIGEEASLPVEATVESAVLGAFVDWTPLRRLRVPAIAPGARRSLAFVAACPPPPKATLPTLDRMTPDGLRTALDMEDDFRPLKPTLAANILEVIGIGGTHWAGNLNILLEGRPAAERHQATALRIVPGKRNAAMFVVGSRTDEYAFGVRGEGAAAWNPALTLMTRALTMRDHAIDDRTERIEERSWVRLRGGTFVMVTFDPPADAAVVGSLEVEVCQRSTGRSTSVEFSFDARAQGPGCYVVA